MGTLTRSVSGGRLEFHPALMSADRTSMESSGERTRLITRPRDRCNLVYILFCMLGLGSLLSWNFFITAKGYFNYKFRNLNASPEHINDPKYMSFMQKAFENDFALAYQMTGIVAASSSALLVGRVSAKARVVTALVILFFLLTFTLVLVNINTDPWQSAFFYITIGTVVLISCACSLLGTTLFGLAGIVPEVYSQALMVGGAVAGLVASLISIFSLLIGGENTVPSAQIYFGCAMGVVFITLLAYLGLGRLDYMKYHMRRNTVTESKVVSRSWRFYWEIFKKVKVWAFSLVMVFFVTLCLFPGPTSLIVSVNADNGSPFTGTYFQPLYFLLFNVGDLVGRTVSFWLVPPKSHVSIPVLAILRVVFIPLFLMCNTGAAFQSLSTVFTSDAYPIIFMALFSVSNGYLCTLSMMLGPREVPLVEAETAGGILNAMLTTGVGLGSVVSYLLLLAL